MRTVDRRARLADDRWRVLCARDLGNGYHCDEQLAAVGELDGNRFVYFDSDWRCYSSAHREYVGTATEADRIKRTGEDRKRHGYAPTRKGWRATVGGRRKMAKTFSFDLPAECPKCHMLNVIVAARLDATDAAQLGVIDAARFGVAEISLG